MGFYNRDNLKLHELTSPRINCKLSKCLQIPKMLVQAAINGANTSSKLRPLAKPTSLLQEKKSARHTAQQRHFQVTSSRNVMSLFLSLGGGLIRSHVLPCFPFFWWNGSLILHNVATRKHFFLCNSNVKRLYTVYQQPINSDHTNSKFKADPLKVVW